jgi:hypothetical protein
MQVLPETLVEAVFLSCRRSLSICCSTGDVHAQCSWLGGSLCVECSVCGLVWLVMLCSPWAILRLNAGFASIVFFVVQYVFYWV